MVEKPKKLTIKQRKLVKGIADGKTQRAAAQSAGMTEQHACECLKKPEVLATIQDLMSKHGLDDVSLLKRHADLIAATKPISIVGTGADATESADVPDWQARAKGLEMAYKLKGAFVDKVSLQNPDGSALSLSVCFVSPPKEQ